MLLHVVAFVYNQRSYAPPWCGSPSRYGENSGGNDTRQTNGPIEAEIISTPGPD